MREGQDIGTAQHLISPPPAYDQPNHRAQRSSSSNVDEFVTVPTANYLSITDVNAISGWWTIDTSWALPLNVFGADFSVPTQDDERQNLFLRSDNGSINAKIRLVDDNTEAARFALETKHSEINVSVVSRGKQPFVLNVTSSSGNLIIKLPRNFNGPIIHETTSSSYTSFSTEMQPHLVTVSVANGSGKTLLNRYDEDQKRQNVGDWSGDRVVAKTGGGYIRFAYEDEPDLSAIVKFFKYFFG